MGKTGSLNLLLAISLSILSQVSSRQIDHSYLSQAYLENQLIPQGELDKGSKQADVDPSHLLISRREGSFEGDVFDSAEDVKARLQVVLKSIRKLINPTIKSIEGDIFKLNRDRVIIAIGNFVASVFFMLAGSAGQPNNINNISGGDRLQVLSAAMYGYGYSRPWQDAYEPPTLTCGRQDFEAALKEYEFLDNPDLETDVSVLVYYSTELNHNIKTKLYCISQRKGSNQDAKELIALIDLYTELQQEMLEALQEEDEYEDDDEEQEEN